MSRPLVPIETAPQASHDLRRAALRRLAASLPLALALLALVIASSALGVLVRNPSMDVRTVLASETWMCVVVIDTCFVACILLAIILADEAVARGAHRPSAYGCAVVAGAAAGSWMQWWTIARLGWTAIPGLSPDMQAVQPLRLFLYALIYGTFGCFVYVNQRTARLAAQRTRAAELERAHSRRRTLESRLQAMQARVEPQFLFNTLGHVCELYERDPAAGGRMLDDLIAYLRAALPHLRESTSTLAREIELVRAYVDIVRMRLPASPSLEIVLPEHLAQGSIPAMTLLPLVDHALARRQRGDGPPGAIRIECASRVVRLRIEFTDSGGDAPSSSDPGAPAGLAERLEALYGPAAEFQLEHALDGTVRVVVEIPLDAHDRTDR